MGRIILIGMTLVWVPVGCAWPGDKARCGWHFEVIKPPVITQDSTILVQSGSPIHSAQPMGHFAGPLVEGQAVYGGSTPQAIIVPQAVSRLRPMVQRESAPCVPPGTLSPDDIERLERLRAAPELAPRKGKSLPMPREDCPPGTEGAKKKEE